MINFDLNQHFQNNFQNKIFLNKTYGDLLSDIGLCSKALPKDLIIAFKIKSPYLLLVAILAGLQENKIALLLSFLESDIALNKLKEQIYFETVMEDHDVLKILDQKNNSLPVVFNFIFKTPLIAILSSGTSSFPRPIVLSFANLYFSAKGFIEYFKATKNDCSWSNLPHHHVGGLMVLWRAFFSGGSFSDQLDSNINFISLVPTQLFRMIKNLEQLEILKKVGVILIGGAPLSNDLKQKALELKLNLVETYGMTESTSLLTANGELLPYREIKIDRDRYIHIKGKTVALGYYQNNKFISFSDDWIKTSDCGFIDADQLFHFEKRGDLIFISGGVNINPIEIETIIKDMAEILAAYLIPIEDEEWNEIGILLYELNDDQLSEAEFLAALKKSLHPHLMPKFIFKTQFKTDLDLKPRRCDLKIIAQELFLKEIFSYQYEEIKNAPLIVFFHGFMGDKDDLKNIAENINSPYSKLLIDLPGHGNTKIKNFHSQLDFFNKLSRFIQLFSKNPIFYGYSMGGRVALHLALNFLPPSLIILESGGLGLKNSAEKLKRLDDDFKLFLKVDQDHLVEFLKRWYQNPLFENFNQHPQYLEKILKKSQHSYLEWKSSLEKLYSPGHFPLKIENIKKLEAASFQMVYFYGAGDQVYKNYALELLKIPIAHPPIIHEIKGAFHHPHQTHPAEISSFLNTLLK